MVPPSANAFTVAGAPIFNALRLPSMSWFHSFVAVNPVEIRLSYYERGKDRTVIFLQSCSKGRCEQVNVLRTSRRCSVS